MASRATGLIETTAINIVADGLAPRRFRVVIGTALLTIAAALTLLSAIDPAGYVAVMRLLSVDVVQRTFIDWLYVADTVRCWQGGHDVWHGNACDVLGRPMDYSPLLLRLSPLATGPAVTIGVAVAVGMAFAAAMIALPVPRCGWGQVVLALAILSPATAFIVERANIDAAIITMLVAAGWAASRHRRGRWIAHGLILTGALAKFYPAAGLALGLRERRWTTIAAIVGLYAIVLGGFVLAYRDELALALANVPHGLFFTNGIFGAAILPRAVAIIIQQIADPALGVATLVGRYRMLASGLQIACISVAVASALMLTWRRPPPAPGVAEGASGVIFLLAGSVLAGCFFAGINIHYRATMAIPLLPLLIRLADDEDRAISATARSAALIIPLLLWIPAVELVLSQSTTTRLGGIDTAVWLVRELLWWAAITRIVAILAWLALAALPAPSLWFRPSASG